MRSNDLLWGTPYDVNGFCFIQEMLASWLGVELGNYIHQAGSMHLYEERVSQLTCLLEDNSVNNESNRNFTGDKFQTEKNLFNFWKIEEKIRAKEQPNQFEMSKLPLFLQDYLKRLTV
jgi:thymidylate synthase